jgi:flagellar basal-body rod protein FlgB
MNLLSKVLDLRSKNQEIISSNIANAETPHYSAVSFEFENQLRNAVDRKNAGGLKPVPGHASHIPLASGDISSVQGTIVTHPDKTGVGDRNSVSVAKEMMNLSKNQILFEAAITMLNKKMSMLKYAANDGR